MIPAAIPSCDASSSQSVTPSATPVNAPAPSPASVQRPVPSDLTDRARLNRALAALRRQGLVVRREFKCCSSCACAAIWSELQPTAESDRPWGFVYYTQQDARAAADGHGLYIRYTHSRNDPSEESMKAIASAIVEVLHDAGLQPEWDGDPERCVYLPLDWSLPPRHRAPAWYGARSPWLALDRT